VLLLRWKDLSLHTFTWTFNSVVFPFTLDKFCCKDKVGFYVGWFVKVFNKHFKDYLLFFFCKDYLFCKDLD
jgi:hypothetical protein